MHLILKTVVVVFTAVLGTFNSPIGLKELTGSFVIDVTASVSFLVKGP